MALRLPLLAAVVAAAVAASSRAGLAHPAAAVNALPGLPVAGLAVGFYNASCPQVEDLVLAEMRVLVAKDRTIGPALLRFMFHDCLVRVRQLIAAASFSSFKFSSSPWRSRTCLLVSRRVHEMRNTSE
jgi:hypothetical protein